MDQHEGRRPRRSRRGVQCDGVVSGVLKTTKIIFADRVGDKIGSAALIVNGDYRGTTAQVSIQQSGSGEIVFHSLTDSLIYVIWLNLLR